VRLLLINRFFHPDQSATAKLLTDLAEELSADGERITVITGRVGYLRREPLRPPHDYYKGVMIHRVWSTRFGRKTALGRLADYVSFYLSAGWAALRCRDIDCLVVLSDPPLLSILGAVVGLLKGWKTVCWLQDVSPENAVRAGVLTHPWLVRPLQVVTAWSLKRATRLVVVGRCMERHLVLTGLPPKRIVLIPNWANGEQLSPVDRTQNWFRDEHGLNGHLIVMYSGNLGVVHETDALMRLIQSLEQDRNVQFVFTGYGKGKERLEE
jgi:hypothetical protein